MAPTTGATSAAADRGVVIEVVRKLTDQRGLRPRPRRRGAVRTIGSLPRRCPLGRDDEPRCDASEATIGVATSELLLRRTGRP